MSSMCIILVVATCIWQAAGSSDSNITDTDFLSSIVVSRNRVFLCAPERTPSLIETSWNGVNTLKTRPKWRTPPTTIARQRTLASKVTRCVSLDLDTRARLWVLDVPKDDGTADGVVARVVILNTALYSELQQCELRGIPTRNLRTIVVDPVVNVQWGPRAYIGDPGDGQLIVYCVKERRWWRLQLQAPTPFIVQTQFLAIARRDAKLFATGSVAHHMYAVSLNDVRKLAGPPAIIGNDVFVNMSSKYLGSKLGPSSGLAVDNKGILYYFLTRDFAIVRCDSKKALLAENHQIMSQSADQLPFVSELFIGPQWNVWALVNAKQHPATDDDANEIKPTLPHRCFKVNYSF